MSSVSAVCVGILVFFSWSRGPLPENRKRNKFEKISFQEDIYYLACRQIDSNGRSDIINNYDAVMHVT